LGLFYSDTFEKWLTVSTFVQIITYHRIPGGFSYPSSIGIWWKVTGSVVLYVRSGLVVGFVLG